MKRMGTVRKWAVAVAVCLAVLCLPGYSEPTPEQIVEWTKLLYEAVKNDDVEWVKLCINHGAYVNARVGGGSTVLMSANSKDVADVLIKAGADVNAKDTNGLTALIFTTSHDRKAIAELLIKAGADVNAKTNDGLTALMYVTYSGRKDIAELLIKAGADGNAALIFAIDNNNEPAAKLLIELGADVNAKDNDGLSLLTHAILYGHNYIADLLRAAGARE